MYAALHLNTLSEIIIIKVNGNFRSGWNSDTKFVFKPLTRAFQ